MKTIAPDLISVIMPCHNAAPYLQAAIGSVLRQSHPQVELIVVDDASTDGSTEILQKLENEHPERITLLYQNRLGPYAARNIGLARAHGAHVAFLEADDMWHPDALARMHQVLQESAADVACCGWQNIEGANPTLPPELDAGEAALHILEHGAWPLNSMLINRQLIDVLQGFSLRAPTAMDTDLWLRMLALNPRLARVPEALAYRRPHARRHAHIPHWQQVFDIVAVRHDFARHHPGRLAQLTPARLQELIYAPLLREAYRSHWRNDTESARRLFRRALRKADWRIVDLKHLLASLLPATLYRQLVNFVTQRRSTQ